MDAICFN